MKLSHLPLRVTTGAFMLNAGLGKRGLEGEDAEALHGMAAGAIPVVKGIDPTTFSRLLSTGEIALGAALLTPIVPASLAGAGLTAFAGGLMWLYWRTPGMHPAGDPRPTREGTALAKDVWLLGAGISLLMGGLAERRSSRA